MRNRPIGLVKASAQNAHFWYKHLHKLCDVYAIRWYELRQWLYAAAAPCYTSVIHCFSSLTSQILFWALMYCFTDFIVIGSIQTWATKAASCLARWILRSHIQWTIKHGSNSNFQVSQGSVSTYLRWDKSPCNSYIDNIFGNLSVKELWKSVYICVAWAAPLQQTVVNESHKRLRVCAWGRGWHLSIWFNVRPIYEVYELQNFIPADRRTKSFIA